MLQSMRSQRVRHDRVTEQQQHAIYNRYKSITNTNIVIYFIFFISWRLITLQYCSGFCHT